MLYRSTRSVGVSVPGRTCSPFPGNPPFSAELSRSLRPGTQQVQRLVVARRLFGFSKDG